MTLRSAYEDFVQQTLAALPGWWRKLQYLAGLRRQEGGYAHWGMDRVHGERAAQEAIAHAHQEVLLEVLRTPLRSLAREVDDGGAEAAAVLGEGGEKLAPEETGGGSPRHFNSVVFALSAIAEQRSQRHSPGASR